MLKIRTLDMHVLDMYRVLEWFTVKATKMYHDLNLFWSIKKWGKPANLSEMFRSEQEGFEQEERRMRTRSVSQNSIRRTQENDSRGLRAGSFVPRMVRTFNALDSTLPGQLLTLKSLPEIDASDEERFDLLKVYLRKYCLWTTLGLCCDWPENREEAMLDCGDQIYRLGIDSKTTEDEDEDGDN